MTTGETEPPVDDSLVQDILRRALEAYNSHDAERLVALMTEDVVIDHSAWPATMRGRAQARSFYADYLWKAFPDSFLELEDGPFLHPHAPRVSFAWRGVGTHTGPLDPPGLAPTGKRIEAPAREIAEFRKWTRKSRTGPHRHGRRPAPTRHASRTGQPRRARDRRTPAATDEGGTPTLELHVANTRPRIVHSRKPGSSK
jgi:SnoaL-like domain